MTGIYQVVRPKTGYGSLVKLYPFNPETVSLRTEFASPFWFTGLVESDIICRMYKCAVG